MKILETDFDETACYKIGKLYALAGKVEEQIATFEKLLETYKTNPTGDWRWEDEAKLTIAEGYAQMGWEERALQLFQEIAEVGTPLYSENVAKAHFEKMKIALSRFERVSKTLLRKKFSPLN